MNKVILKGNLCADPVVKVVEISGKNVSVVNVVVAVSRKFTKANGEKSQETAFVPCEAWDSSAQIIGKYLKKGSPILLEGTIKTESWETEDGQKRSKLKVRITNFELLYSKNGGNNNSNNDTNDTTTATDTPSSEELEF